MISPRSIQFSGEQPALGSAFTLIELLIAVAISALVLVTISTMFFSAIHLRDRTSAAAEQTSPVDRAVSIMKRDLVCIMPVGVLAGPMGSDAAGQGMIQPPLLEMFTGSANPDADTTWGDVQKVDYSLQAPTNKNAIPGMNLMRGVTRNILASTSITPTQQTLLSGVQNLKFSYFDGTNWNDTWSTTLSNIPVAIKVSIDFMPPAPKAPVNPSVQFISPIVSWSNTNSITNQISN